MKVLPMISAANRLARCSRVISLTQPYCLKLEVAPCSVAQLESLTAISVTPGGSLVHL